MWDNSDDRWETTNVTITNDSTGVYTGGDGNYVISTGGAMTGTIEWAGLPALVNCVVCDAEQELAICGVCNVAVKEYRNEAFRKQIEELL